MFSAWIVAKDAFKIISTPLRNGKNNLMLPCLFLGDIWTWNTIEHKRKNSNCNRLSSQPTDLHLNSRTLLKIKTLMRLLCLKSSIFQQHGGNLQISSPHTTSCKTSLPVYKPHCLPPSKDSMVLLPANASCPMAGSQVEQSINKELASALVRLMGREVLDMMLQCFFNNVNLVLHSFTMIYQQPKTS